MARKDNLIKSKSIYTIRNKHQVTNNGVIYENDHVTIVPNDGIYDNEVYLFSDSNFKYKIRTDSDEKRRHIRSEWISPEGASSTTWTFANVSAKTKSEESKIVNKPNYTSLSDFAYYGSATELIKATINDIILRFPGGISHYCQGSYGIDSIAPYLEIEGEDYFLLSNEFNIDFWTRGNVDESTLENPMRVLAASYMNYERNGGDGVVRFDVSGDSQCRNSIIGGVTFNGWDGYNFPVYMNGDGEKYLLCKLGSTNGGWIIRPKKKYYDEFWQTLDDFERVLLNRATKPVYKATFDTPYETENGFFYNKKNYIWPTVADDGITPDITTIAFNGYLNSLLSLAEFYDTHYSDNIWRMLTHESIKNLDWTFLRNNESESENVEIDDSRISAMLHVYGRNFDDIKRYSDNIKYSTYISYDERNNTPDYFLTDNVENEGWEAKSINPGINVISENVYSGSTISGKTTSQVNSDFMRRLFLNSDYIQSLKGTRRGIEAILGMFGYSEYAGSGSTTTAGTYKINEYIAVAKSKINYNYASEIKSSCQYSYFDEQTNIMEGYPVAVVSPASNSGNNESNYYLIPWFDKNEKYDYPFYFQTKGGWCKTDSKSINLPITSAKTIHEGIDVKLYGETEPYMGYANNVSSLKSMINKDIFSNMICYVTDISEIYNGYSASPEDSEYDDFSHYFILKKTSLSHNIGYVDNELYSCYGWRNIYIHEFAGEEPTTDDGLRVLYLESLHANYKGNNPHTGKGNYDDGAEYIEKFDRLFGDAIDNGVFEELKYGDEYEKELYNRALSLGFNVENMICDNKKCHSFVDCTVDSDFEIIYKAGVGQTSSCDAPINGNLIIIGNEDDYSYDTDSGYSHFVNYEGKCPFDEAAANSVINIKNIEINFGTSGCEYLKKFIENVVFVYLKEMIPSTAIFSIKFDGGISNHPIPVIIDNGNNTGVEHVADIAAIDEDDSIYIDKNKDS